MDDHNTAMAEAIKQAVEAGQRGEVPVGAVLFDSAQKRVVAACGNDMIAAADPTAHAEINVIRARCAELGVMRLPDHDLFVTLEPCPMCAAAIAAARIRRVYFGAYDPKGGGVEHGPKIFDHAACHHRPEIVGGLNEAECAALLKNFFSIRR